MITLDWQLVEYFIIIETKYRPAFSGKWYLLQTKRQSLYNLKLYNVSKTTLIVSEPISSKSVIYVF